MSILRREKRFGGFTVAGVEQTRKKNRGAQPLAVAGMLAVGFGGILAGGGSVVGYVLLPAGMLCLLATFLWALKRWEY